MAGTTGLTAEGLAKENKALKTQLEELRGRESWVAIRHLTDNERAIIRPFGGNPDGSDDIVFSGYGNVQRVPVDKWRDMIEKKVNDISEGTFVRDKSIPSSRLFSITNESFGEEDFPNAILDSEIEELFKGNDAAMKKKLGQINQFFILERFDRISKTFKGVASKNELVRGRYLELVKMDIWPDDFEGADCQRLLKIASKWNFVPKNLTIDLDGTRDDMAAQETQLRGQLRRFLEGLEREMMRV